MSDREREDVLIVPERLQMANDRFGDFGRPGFWDRVAAVASAVADPSRALANFERWLAAAGSSEIRAGIVDDSAAFAIRLLTIFGASQTIANELIRDPDAAMLLLDDHEISHPIVAREVHEEAIRLFSTAISFQHKLDQLRFLQKRSLARIVWQDLSGKVDAQQVWYSLSELADGLLMGALQACADEYDFDTFYLSVVAMGKHGSRELNYASDIDLIFVLEDGIPDLESASRFCERFVRSVSGKMGRGDLYRVDLRLRPFGKSGPVAHTLTAFRRYIENYAEPWELVALVRSRVCAGSQSLGEQFTQMVEDQVYRGPRSDWFFDSLFETKRRAERATPDPHNVKFAPGGIRDVEFIVQILQLVGGKDLRELRGASTLAALELFERERLVDSRDARLLSKAYQFYRQLEHRIQLTHEIHSHSLPKGKRERLVLARAMRYEEWGQLFEDFSRLTSDVRKILLKRFPEAFDACREPKEVLDFLGFSRGSKEATALERLVSGIVGDADARDMISDEAIRHRVELIVRMAPRVISDVAFHRELWDIAFSEEIEFSEHDDENLIAKWREDLAASGDKWESAIARLARHVAVASCLKQAYHRDVVRSGRFQSAAADVMLLFTLDKCGGEALDIVALGGYGSMELLHGSDWDVMLVAPTTDDQREHEKIGEAWMRLIRRIAVGSPFPVDPRLRPEGRSGLLVVTASGLSRYAQGTMEAWERMAYTRARPVRGLDATRQLLLDSAYGKPWSETDEAEALHLRSRVHSERAHPSEAARDIKLGPGGLFDIEWLVALLKLRNETPARCHSSTTESLSELANARSITVLERDTLLHAHVQFSLLRNVMYLLEMESDSVLPENPDKLERIAVWLKMGSANELLQNVEHTRGEVEAVFNSILGSSRL